MMVILDNLSTKGRKNIQAPIPLSDELLFNKDFMAWLFEKLEP